MQSNPNDIFKLTAERTGKSEQMYKDIGQFVFRETSQLLKEPTSLILKLKGVGSWRLRKKRMELVVSEYPDRLKEPKREDFENEATYLINLDKHKQYLVFLERLEEYDRYMAAKKIIRDKRHETAILLEPNKGED